MLRVSGGKDLQYVECRHLHASESEETEDYHTEHGGRRKKKGEEKKKINEKLRSAKTAFYGKGIDSTQSTGTTEFFSVKNFAYEERLGERGGWEQSAWMACTTAVEWARCSVEQGILTTLLA